MIVSSNTKISRTFLCDELVHPDATDASICTYQDSPSHCSCQIKTCMSQSDSIKLMEDRLSPLELSPSEFDFYMTGKLKASTITYSQLASLKKARGKGRKLSYTIYFHWGKPVCHRIAKTRLVNVARNQRETSLTWRQKGSGLRNKRAITYNQHVAAHPFLKKSGEKNGSKLPGRVKGELNIYLSISCSFIYLPSPYTCLYLPTIPSHVHPFPPSSPSPVSSHSNNLCAVLPLSFMWICCCYWAVKSQLETRFTLSIAIC